MFVCFFVPNNYFIFLCVFFFILAFFAFVIFEISMSHLLFYFVTFAFAMFIFGFFYSVNEYLRFLCHFCIPYVLFEFSKFTFDL